MKKIFKLIVVIVLTVLVVNAFDHHKRHARFNHQEQKNMRFEKGKTAYVEVGNLLKPYEVANLMANNLL